MASEFFTGDCTTRGKPSDAVPSKTSLNHSSLLPDIADTKQPKRNTSPEFHDRIQKLCSRWAGKKPDQRSSKGFASVSEREIDASHPPTDGPRIAGASRSPRLTVYEDGQPV
jgi:hypothetical protein